PAAHGEADGRRSAPKLRHQRTASACAQADTQARSASKQYAAEARLIRTQVSTMGGWTNVAGELSMAVNTSFTRAEHAKIRAHLGALRASLTQARDALMHFKGDRLDRDKREPASRRVDDLM